MEEHAFTLEQVIKWTNHISGLGITSDRDKIIDLIRESIDALVNEESNENLRSWEVLAIAGLVILPKQISVPAKYKIYGSVGPVKNLYYQFKGYIPRQDCRDYREDLEFHSESPVLFPLPKQGGRVAAKSQDFFEQDCKIQPYLLVQGIDLQGREIFTPNDGKMDVGERIYISQPSDAPPYSINVFKEITSVRVVGAQLNIQFVWCNTHNYGDTPFEAGVLALYDAGDEMPKFRKFILHGLRCNDITKVDILGSLAKPRLKYDNELIHGFDSNTIRSMIRANWNRGKNDINSATFNSNIAVASIRKQNERQNPDTDQLVVHIPTCAGKFPQTY